MTQMRDAHDHWDSARVVSLGAQAEADLLVIDFPLKGKVQIEMYEMMARACSRIGQYTQARDYFERLLSMFDPVQQFQEHTRTLIRTADMDMRLGHADKAKLLYEKVFTIGESSGNFEYHSKACLGLARIEHALGNKTAATSLAWQALDAAGLLLDGDYSKARDSAQAIISILDYSDIKSDEFDETLLKRLDQLVTAVDTTEDGGTALVVKAAELQWRRAFAMSRWEECANACAKTMRLANQTRFKQNPDIQAVHANALQVMEDLLALGVIEMNPER